LLIASVRGLGIRKFIEFIEFVEFIETGDA